MRPRVVLQRFAVLAVIVVQRLDRHVESDPTPEAKREGVESL